MKRCILVIVLLLFPACENQRFGAREKGALGGAALGAGLGAIVGHATGSTGAGIAIGSAFGALSGGLVGEGIDQQDEATRERDLQIERQDRALAENQRIINELKSSGLDVHKTKRGVVVNLPDVLFQFNKASLTSAARHTISEIAHSIKNMRSRHQIAVEGHTDSIGTVAYNQRLSQERARSVAGELVASGVSRGQVSTRGFGESRPIASNSSEDGRRKNRRVEVVIENH